MVELLKTTDRVRLSFLAAVLADAGVESDIFDQGAGALWGQAIAPRLMVAEEDLARAKRIVAEAERGES